MKAWIISISVIGFTVMLGLSIYLYQVIAEPIRDRQEQAVSLAGEQLDFTEVRGVEYYHGRRSYQIIDAVDEDGNDVYIWVEERDDEDEPNIETRLHSDGLSKQQVIDIAQQELTMERLKSVQLGMIGSTPVYEVNYIDELDRHSFYYLTFEDGTYIRHYQFLS
ncbi:hypothetical protein CR194_03150 [Salipaludibacillus keqinensis]|uniref:Uncharacterized protein n=1 Tax=Salipaludibacillus keqinensis TaxID=2045207 RepID=A0A323TYC5_9BACI|nr:DUF5590 domain-containing protein [Salipaludibacillus keqinensis]PYZ94545.1 hypothetical protein CR194_03150 [Salipaludibacillus keqinensis]